MAQICYIFKNKFKISITNIEVWLLYNGCHSRFVLMRKRSGEHNISASVGVFPHTRKCSGCSISVNLMILNHCRMPKLKDVPTSGIEDSLAARCSQAITFPDS